MSLPQIPMEGWLADDALQQLLSILSVEGEEARVNGGAVRNSLMGIPVNDVDVSTTLVPQAVIELLEKAGVTSIPTGVDHGTVTAIVDGRPFEITTLREDIETDGRHAVVRFGRDWSLDALRRDLTMNALYCDATGRVFDPLGGYDDLKNRHVRFIGKAEERITEDYLRILRFFRFFAIYGNARPDADGLKACAKLKSGITELSAERVWKELKLLLAAPDPSRALLWLRTTGVLSVTLPETEKWGIDLIPALIATENDLGWKPDAFIRLMAIIRPDERVARGLSNRLKLANAEAHRLITWSTTPAPSLSISHSEFQKLLYRGDVLAHADVLRLSIAQANAADNREAARDAKALLKIVVGWQRPEFPVKGQDLIDRGHAPGPDLGKKLKMMEEAWVESDFELTPDVLLMGEGGE